MFELTKDHLPQLKISTRLIANELLDRGLKVQGFLSSPALLQVDVPGTSMPMRLFSVIDESMSFIAGRGIAGNKQVTNALVKNMGIAVPDELYITKENLTAKQDSISRFITTHGAVVAKPIDGAHGKAVYTGIDSFEQLNSLADSILAESRFTGFLVQQQLSGFDIRVVCIGGEYASAMTRVPATVTGDGEHTVEQLIDIENHHANRSGEDYHTLYNKINGEYVRNYLSSDELQSVPELGELRQVIGISNVGVGGTRKNLDTDLPDFLIKQAEAIARELRLPVCGVDFFVDRIPRAQMTNNELHPTVIEVNNCPGLTMYESYDDPRQKILATKLVDAQLEAHRKLCAMQA